MPTLLLKPGREKSLLRRHPWIFSGAIEQVTGSPRPGETVEVRDSQGNWLARAAYSPASQIRARVWTFDLEESVDVDFFRRRISAALKQRAVFGLSPLPVGEGPGFQSAGDPQRAQPPLPVGEGPGVRAISDSMRLIHAESDGLPGLVVDRYGEILVLQSLTTGCEFWRETLADLLLEQTGAAAIYERSDADVRELEGLQPRTGLLRGSNIESRITITEYGLKFLADIQSGHKTGFYLDQRANRKRVGELAQGRDALNCFCYTGGFSIHAAAGGAKSVLSVDTSSEALMLGRENARLNGIPDSSVDWLEADVFTALRKFRDQNRAWDLIILDPPKFAPTAAQAEKAARGYKDINRLAFKLLRPGGGGGGGRYPGHVFMFRRHRCGLVPKDCGFSGARCGRRCPDCRISFSGTRPPGLDSLSRRGVPEGVGACEGVDIP